MTLGAGQHSFNVTLFGDRLADAADVEGGGPLAVELIYALQSDQLLEGAWERRVLASLTESAGAVTRLDERTLRVTIDRSVLYDTRKPEVVSVAVPGALLASRQRTVAQPNFVLYAARGAASLSGSLMARNTEADVRSAEWYTLDVTLRDDRFVRHLNLPAGAAVVRELLGGLRVAHAFAGGH